MVIEQGLASALRLYREGRFEDAIAALDAAAPGDDPAACDCLRGIILKDSGRDAEAVTAFDRAIERSPDLERAHYHRGTARFLAGDKRGALADLERAMEMEPDFLFAVYNLGVAAVGARDWERAKRAFSRCIDLDPAQKDEYVELLVEIGRGAAQEEVYAQGHRLKNLLGVIGDNYRTLLGEVRETDGVEERVTRRARSIEEDLQHLYQDMVQFLRAVDTAPPTVDLISIGDLIERCLFALSPRLRRIRVERRFADGVPEVIGDKKSLGEALVNVLTNAVEAVAGRVGEAPRESPIPTTGSGSFRFVEGISAILAKESEAQLGAIRISIEAIDDLPEVPGIDSVKVTVEDTGPGIAPEHLARVFEFGYTTKRFGSGLGLSYADRVVRAHGGRIEVSSPPGEGARVILILPASPVGAPNLRTLGLRSLLFEDLRGLAIRGGVHAGRDAGEIDVSGGGWSP